MKTLLPSMIGAMAIASAALFAPTAEARHGAQKIYLDVNGHGDRIPLKRLLRHSGYRIDFDRYRLTGVTVHSKKKRHRRAHRGPMLASLQVGNHYTPYRELNRRHTYVHAPYANHGRWALEVSPNTRVRGVTLHLAPKWRSARRDFRRFRDSWPYAIDNHGYDNHRYDNRRYNRQYRRYRH